MRRKRNVERSIAPDVRYGSTLVAKFINTLMRQGKKTVAEKVVRRAFEIVGRESGEDALAVFQRAVANASPILEIRPRRIGGATYQVPREVSPKRRTILAFRWIASAARSRAGKPMAARVAEEIQLAAKGEGSAMKRKHDMHRMAEANRAFAHFSW